MKKSLVCLCGPFALCRRGCSEFHEGMVPYETARLELPSCNAVATRSFFILNVVLEYHTRNIVFKRKVLDEKRYQITGGKNEKRHSLSQAVVKLGVLSVHPIYVARL